MIEMPVSPACRWRAVVALLAVLTALCALSACAESTTRSPAAVTPPPATTTVPPAAVTTQARVFSPFRDGTLATPVADRQNGTCWTSSIAVPRAGAYRCLSVNQILDPCFVAPGRAHPRQVACFADPWSPATVITLTKALPRTRPVVHESKPWAVQLANGTRCVSVTGTVRTYRGVALDYSCARGRWAGLRGSAPERGHVLHVAFGTASHGTALRNVLVTVAWN